MTREKIDKKLKEWIDNDGEDMLRKATKEAQETIEEWKKLSKIDYLTLLEPFGI